MPASPIPVVFIHGLWIHSDAWQPWVELYRSAGYGAIAPGWPGDSASVEQTRKNAAAVAGQGIDDITDGYLDVIGALPAKPIVIGHSFGGLIAQKLLSAGAATAAGPVTRGGRYRSPSGSSATASATRSPRPNPGRCSTSGRSPGRASRSLRPRPPTLRSHLLLLSTLRSGTAARC